MSYLAPSEDDWHQTFENMTHVEERWSYSAQSAQYEWARNALSSRFKTASYYDYDTSKRLAHLATPVFCYWNAAGQLLTQPDLAGYDYCEGVSVHVWTQRSGRPSVMVAAEGFLMKPDGGVVDSTPLVGNSPSVIVSKRTDLERAVYIPLGRYSKEYVGDNWDSIPFSCESFYGVKTLVETINTAIGILDSSTRLAVVPSIHLA